MHIYGKDLEQVSSLQVFLENIEMNGLSNLGSKSV